MTPEETLAALLSLPALAAPAVSPDGKWAAWTWYRTGPAAEVFVAPTDGSAAPLRLTDSPDDSVVVSWTPDSRSLLVEEDHDGDERARLYRVDPARPGERVLLTDEAPEYFLRGGQLHPSGRWVVYGANYDFAAGREIEATWVYRHDLETGERRPLARPERGHHYEPRLNRAGTHVLYARADLHPAGEQVWLVDIEGERDREILNFGAEVKVFASWFPDSRRVLVLAEAGTHRRLGVWDLETGALRWVLDDPSRNLESAFVPLGSERAVLVEVREARLRASLLDVETGEETPLVPLEGNLLPLAPAADGAWVGQYFSARQPADLVRFSLDDLAPERFTSLTRVWERTPLRPADLAPAEDFRWRSVDGLEIQGWLYRARGRAKGTIVYVHGGPTAYSADRLNHQVQFLVSRGFNILDPNYRGSTGFSLQFREAIRADGWGGREQEDIRTGIEALVRAGIAEPGRVGVTGTSYGGYSSWCAITRYPPDLVAAAAPICGMTDLVADYEITRPDIRPYTEEMMGGRPDQLPELYHNRSPVHFVRNIRGRLLIVQGIQDPNVPMEHVEVVLPRLREAGVHYELLAFEDEGHGIVKPKNQRVLFQRLVEFFEGAFEGSC